MFFVLTVRTIEGHSIAMVSLICGVLAEKLFDGSDVFGRSTSALILPSLAQFDFEAFFHRAIMLGALLFIWPLLRWLRIRNARDLGLEPNPQWLRDTAMGFLISTGPLLCCALILLGVGVYAVRASI